MKRQASIQNLFSEKRNANRPVSDSAEVGYASNKVSSGVANTSTIDPAPVTGDFNQGLQTVNANDNFKTLHAQVKEISAKLDIKEEIPRVCRLQTALDNVPYRTKEEYCRRAVYVPFLDDFCNSLKESFESHKETVASLQHIVPEFCTKIDFCSLEVAFNFYED
ncbi:hypothetical protein AVEN_106887-1 [Araneus ventricosus]|uniref:Uncharacterized protein n=1 Tax=Araneus ventricosus TaxID=182803 RepID=A0A4Y2S6W0_ARAVE|nr:hypothetical protein AVEN_106887-1 [Araneus ventricosus]